MNLYPILLSIAAFTSTFLGGLLATKYREQVGRFAAFSAGVLIAVPLFDLLPETFRLAAQANVPLENVMYVTALGFIPARRADPAGACRGGVPGDVIILVYRFFSFWLPSLVGFPLIPVLQRATSRAAPGTGTQ
jgi:zinc transporter ZupT